MELPKEHTTPQPNTATNLKTLLKQHIERIELSSKHRPHINNDIELCITCACGTPEYCQYNCAHNKPCYYYPKKELK